MIPVVEVTLLEDRAQVRRAGAISLEPGLIELCIDGVSPLLVDKTLSARVDGAARVVDVCVSRRQIVRAESAIELDGAVREAEGVLESLEARREGLDAQLQHLEQAVVLTLNELAEDVSWGRADTERFAKRLERLRADSSERRRERARLELDEERQGWELNDLRRQRQVLMNPASRRETSIVVKLVAETPGTVMLELDYLVPNACWRPWHRARWSGGRLRFASEACVWQNTGEDWNDVQLLLSTARASLGVTPPDLEDDRLRARKVGPEVHVSTRSQSIAHTAGGEKVVSEVAGIDDGGEVVHLRAAQKISMRSDSRPVRVPLFEFETEAALERVLYPELAEAVLLRSEPCNTGPSGLLPGPVDLVLESGLVGRTQIDFVAVGQNFELGWGPDPAFRVHRDLVREPLEARMLSSWTGEKSQVEVRLSNTGLVPQTIQVTERVPVSEVEKVRVTSLPEETSAEKRPDSDGFVRWSLEVAGASVETLKLAWTVERHSDVVSR